MTTDQQIEICNRLLENTSEPDIKADLRSLLFAMGASNELEVQTGKGPADVFLPQHRVVIEIKSRGYAKAPHHPQARENDETPFEQLERYVKALRSTYLNRLDLEDHGKRPWLGIVTDGRIWHLWRWPNRQNAQAETDQQDFIPLDAPSLIKWLDSLLHKGGLVGRPWPPVQLAQEFLPGLADWIGLYANLDGKAAEHTQTKWELWRDMMIVSGMLPANIHARTRLFVAHSYLVMIARGIIWTLTHREDDRPNPETVYGDGFLAWVLEQQTGRQMATSLLNRIHGWDWRARSGDILRDVYEELIDENDRRDFGEFYTPDWLAELLVQTILDPGWCKESIQAARNPGGLAEGIGVMDPACGSGTFLYHAIQHILSQPTIKDLTSVRQADVVASLVNGLDVHPVAVEIARATLLRSLPAEPTAGVSAIRIYIGDSLNTPRQAEGLMQQLEDPNDGNLKVTTPQGTTMTIPSEWVFRDNFDDQLRLLVMAAKEDRQLPPEISEEMQSGGKNLLIDLHAKLTQVIKREGNSVWTWFISHRSGSDRLRHRKVNRLIANPPWVQRSDIQLEERKNALRDLAKDENLWDGGVNAPNYDIAQLFIIRCRKDFLQDPKNDPAIWIVKRSAIGGSNWQKFREKHKEILKDRIQLVDLDSLNPFDGGDARRCCLILENTNLHKYDQNQLQALSLPRGRKLASHEKLHQIDNLLKFETVPELLPQAPSAYRDGRGNPYFRNGATINPHILVMINQTEAGKRPDQRRVTTKPSQVNNPKSVWKDVNPQVGEVPVSWIQPVLRSEHLLPFTILEGSEMIIPFEDRSGMLSANPDEKCLFWCDLERIYQERSKGKLLENIDHHNKLSKQLPIIYQEDQRLFLYPTSGNHMRAARSIPRIIDSTLYYFKFDQPVQAAFLVGILNASCLDRAFRESKSSGRHFHHYPWQKIPIPEFDKTQELHKRLVTATEKAEEAANKVVEEASKKKGQRSLSNRIREALKDKGIMDEINECARKILPNQAD